MPGVDRIEKLLGIDRADSGGSLDESGAEFPASSSQELHWATFDIEDREEVLQGLSDLATEAYLRRSAPEQPVVPALENFSH